MSANSHRGKEGRVGRIYPQLTERRMKAPARLFLVLSPLVLAQNVFAQHQTFNIDPNASHVDFVLGATGHHVHGTFQVQSGPIDFDRSLSTISGSVIVVADSGESGNASRDHKMKSDVLDVV